MYQALYRKYRPNNFNDVFGQKYIVNTLINAITNKKISHAYLFSGPRGTGKTSIAKVFARTANCENLNGIIPCNYCESCLQSNTKQNTDIIEIDAASNNGVDEIRELKNKINLVPSFGKYKIYIIDEVHMLTISAFNALLKTLEEPPAHIIFILATTEPYKLPSTILSRCQRFDFKKIPNEIICEKLNYIADQEKINVEEDALNEIARLSDGGMRDAISLLDQVSSYVDDKVTVEAVHEINGTLSQSTIKQFIIKLKEKNLHEILKKIKEYNDNGKNLVKLIEEIILFLRNLLIYKKDPQFLKENSFEIDNYNDENLKFTTEEILNYIKEFNDCINDMKNNNNPRIIVELLFIKITSNLDANKVPDLVQLVSNEQIKEEPVIKSIKNEKEEIKKTPIKTINKDLRINNTLATFDKKNLNEIKLNLDKVKEYLLDKKYSQSVSIILDGVLKASGEKNLIFVYKNKQDAEIFNENITIIEELLYKVFSNNYKVIAVDDSDWEIIKKEFNGKQKNYKYIEEPEVKTTSESIENPEQKNDTIKDLFKDAIEYI